MMNSAQQQRQQQKGLPSPLEPFEIEHVKARSQSKLQQQQQTLEGEAGRGDEQQQDHNEEFDKYHYAEQEGSDVERHLQLLDLIMIGVGGTVGSGIFVLTGYIAHNYSGPATWLSFFISGLAACCSGICYAELSGLVPYSGSTYLYARLFLGERYAVVGAACLTLEYAVSGAAVARSWGDKVAMLLFMHQQAGEQESFEEQGGETSESASINVMAFVVSALSSIVLLSGVQESKLVTNTFTILKVVLVAFMIIGGFAAFRSSNITGALITAESEVQSDRDNNDGSTGITLLSLLSYFWISPRGGAKGILRGSTSSFFAYLGYDEVCCLAGESVNPARDMPKAVLYTLAIVTGLYILASIALCGMIPYTQINDTSGFPKAFHDIQMYWASSICAYGEILTLPVVVLIALMAQPRLLYAMSKDGILPQQIFSKKRTTTVSNNNHDDSGLNTNANSSSSSKKQLWYWTLISGLSMTFIATFIPFGYLDDFISVGILLAFCMTNSCLIIMRSSHNSNSNNSSSNIFKEIQNHHQNTILCQPLLPSLCSSSLESSLLMFNAFCCVFGLICRHALQYGLGQILTILFGIILVVAVFRIALDFFPAVNHPRFDNAWTRVQNQNHDKKSGKTTLLRTSPEATESTINYKNNDDDSNEGMDKKYNNGKYKTSHKCKNDCIIDESSIGHSITIISAAASAAAETGTNFQTPLVPYLPCLGIFINWYLITQLEVSGLFFSFLYVVLTLTLHHFFVVLPRRKTHQHITNKDDDSNNSGYEHEYSFLNTTEELHHQ